jgi:glyoxylase-like metal-dependent hydrolase (beta-lactamase superfamily II)
MRNRASKLQADWCPSRRTVLAGATATLALTSIAPGLADAAQNEIKAGRFKITTLSDGHLTLPTTMVAPETEAAAREKALAAAGQSGTNYRSPLNVTLLESEKEKILLDAGAGTRFMQSAGKLEEALMDKGLEPDQITHVVFTHAHPDHLWGTINDFDEIAFPSASFHISEAEWNFWMADDVLTKLDEQRKAFAVGAQRNLKAIKERISMFKPGAELVTGLRAIDTSGHTPGHVSFEVGDGKSLVAVLGDALTHPVVSFEYPDWQPAMDQEADKAVATRKRLLDRLAADKHQLIGYHLPEPGLGRVVRKGQGFAFEAAG